MIAVGGWGDTGNGFSDAAKSETGITKFATDAATMLTNTGADGVGELTHLNHSGPLANGH
jgi:chitinase